MTNAATTPADGVGPRWSQEGLLGLSRAFMECRLLLTGAELDLFTMLGAAPLAADEVANRLGGDRHALCILLDALAAMGLLVKRGGTWQTEPSAARLLTASGPESVLPMVRHNAHLWRRWGELGGLVASPAALEKAAEDWLGPFIGAMHVVAEPNAARIVSLVSPGAARSLLDVGGASGTYTLAFLRASAELKATLFDRPPVVPMARARLEAAGMIDRVTLVAGDFYEDALPKGHDLAFVSAIIHQNSPTENVELFRKVGDALDPGGRIVIRDHVLTPDRTEPKAGALFAVNMLVGRTGGNSYTQPEIEDALKQAGFVRARLLHPDTRMDGLIEAFKPS